jgi:hypothetical protein
MFARQNLPTQTTKTKMQPAFYAILPAFVRYNTDLSAMSKLLYCEITALCNAKGYCWASTTYFAKLYNVSERTVSAWINELRVREFVYISLKRTPNGTQRIITLNDTLLTTLAPEVQKLVNPQEENFQCLKDPQEENFLTAQEENFHHNNLIVNNNADTKVSAIGAGRKKVEKIEKPETDFDKFKKWLSEYAPRVLKMDEPFTEEQYLRLKQKHSNVLVKDVLQSMHNTKTLLKKYTSAYRTCCEWCKRRVDGPGGEVNKANEKLKG